jgi:hypothetical protein
MPICETRERETSSVRRLTRVLAPIPLGIMKAEVNPCGRLLRRCDFHRSLRCHHYLPLDAIKRRRPKPAAAAAPYYSPHWWESVSKEGAPHWQIVPQEAGAGEVILSKRNDLGLLSNFAARPFEFHGDRAADSVRCQAGRGSRQPQYGENGHRLRHVEGKQMPYRPKQPGEQVSSHQEVTRAKVHLKSKMLRV